MDPFGVGNSALSIAAIGFAVACGLYEIADGIGSAGLEVRTYADEIDLFSKLLTTVREELLKPSNHASGESSLIKDLLDICNRVLLPLQRLQSTLKPLLDHFRSSPGKFHQFGLRVRWIFSTKAKLLFYRDALSFQRGVLSTTIGLITLQANRKKGPQVVCVLRSSLENSIAATTHALKESSIFTRRSVRYSQSSSDHMSLVEVGPAIIEGAVSIEQPQKQEAEQDPTQGSSTTSDWKETSQVALTISPLSESNDVTDGLSEEEILNLDNQIEHDLDPDSNVSAQEVWEDMRSISRRVLRVASEALQLNQEDSLAPELGSTSAASTGSSNVVSETIATSSTTIPTATVLNTTEPIETITFEDSDGNTYELPYDEIREYDNMLHVIRYDIYQNKVYFSDKYNGGYLSWGVKDSPRASRNLTDPSNFSLIGPSGQIILPRLWNRVVRPCWKVTLRFQNELFSKDSPPEIKNEELEAKLERTKKSSKKSSSGRLTDFLRSI